MGTSEVHKVTIVIVVVAKVGAREPIMVAAAVMEAEAGAREVLAQSHLARLRETAPRGGLLVEGY